jgi:hypothetical protein
MVFHAFSAACLCIDDFAFMFVFCWPQMKGSI